MSKSVNFKASSIQLVCGASKEKYFLLKLQKNYDRTMSLFWNIVPDPLDNTQPVEIRFYRNYSLLVKL